MKMNLSENNFDYGKVAVLLGGTSAERNISLISGDAIYRGLKTSGLDVVKIDTKFNPYQQLEKNKIDRVFIALHGRDGEDGVIQGFLKTLNIPYTGSDIASSALAMNKLLCKQIWLQQGLNTAKFVNVDQYQRLTLTDVNNIIKALGSVLFVKPIREGSSVGMSKITNPSELLIAIQQAQKYDDVLVEKFIDGREYTVSILDEKTLPSISMVTPNNFYDYDAKYCANTTTYYCPSGLSEKEETLLQKMAMKAFKILGCSGWGRVDFIQDEQTRKFMLLEVNTVPGMTESSLVPKAAKAVGIGFPELALRILQTSFNKEIEGGEKGGSHG